MKKSSEKKQCPLPDNVIPLFNNDRNENQSEKATDTEAFRIRTDDIFYLLLLHIDINHQTHGKGYAVFKSGETVQFAIDPNGDSTVREKCICAGKQIARQYHANLEYGTVDSKGRFTPHRLL